MPIITLTTDFGLKDPSVASVKGAIYSALGEAKIVDITHDILPFDIAEAAYIIKNAYQAFPKGSIHILGVDSEFTPENNHIAVKLDGHYFIGANNGMISLIANEILPEICVEINIHHKTLSNFPVLDIFVQVASHIARGGTLEVIGKRTADIKRLKYIEPTISNFEKTTKINGNVLYVDNYGNAVSNISKKLFDAIGKGRDFVISARGFNFNKIFKNYSDIIDLNNPKSINDAPGKRLAIFNTANYLEISIYKSNPNTVGSASTLLGLKYTEPITVTFYDQNLKS